MHSTNIPPALPNVQGRAERERNYGVACTSLSFSVSILAYGWLIQGRTQSKKGCEKVPGLLMCFRMPLPFSCVQTSPGLKESMIPQGCQRPHLIKDETHILLNSQDHGTSRILRSWGSRSSRTTWHAYPSAHAPLSHWISQ